MPFTSGDNATKTDVLSLDIDGDMAADPGDTLKYTIIVTKSGDIEATNVVFSDTIDSNTTLVPGSIKTSPIARNESYSALGNVSMTVPTAAEGVIGTDTVTGDNDSDGGTVTVTAVQGSGANVGSATATDQTGLGSVSGFVTMAADGSFTYEPPPGFEGTNTFSYEITDDEGQTDTATVSITINDMVWFIDNSAGGSANRGTLANPFTSIASFNAVQGANTPNAKPGDVVFIHTGSGSYGTGIILQNDQVLFGQGINLHGQLGALTTPIVPPAFSDLTVSNPATGSRPVIAPGSENGIRLAANNIVRGLNVGNTPGGSVKTDDPDTMDFGDETCTQIALEPGNIIIRKITQPTGAAGTFDFSDTITAPNAFSLADGGTQSFNNVASGAYTVSKADPAMTPGGFDLTGLNCDDGNSSRDVGSRTASIKLEPGETVTCTFTNSQRGSISKSSNPVTPTNFTFTTDVPPGAPFTLDDAAPDDGDAFGNSITFMDVPVGTYQVTEVPPGDGYSLNSIACDDGTSITPSSGSVGNRTATINLDPGESVICTFANRQSQGGGNIYLPLIYKKAIPAPNLVVDNLIATTEAITVVVKDIGSTAVVNAFWVDVYLNPSPAPSGVNRRAAGQLAKLAWA